MEIKRYCGRERLPGGTRRWQRMARRADFDGRLHVFGYGVGGVPGRQQRFAYRHGQVGGYIQGDWHSEHQTIRIWLPCRCAVVEFDAELDLDDRDHPLEVFAHELGHAIQHQRGRIYDTDSRDEAVATRYGRFLLRSTQ